MGSSRDRERDRERSRRQAASSKGFNEYFVPNPGIDREVITADICRYLGNDALVRPGNYEVYTFQPIQKTANILKLPFKTPKSDKSRKDILSNLTEISQQQDWLIDLPEIC
jgi:hypothetical protein